MDFKDIFKDDNVINEKNVVGFSSFIVMILFAIVDIVAGFIGIDLGVKEFMYNSFVFITLGCFGIDGITRIFKKPENL